MTTTKRALVTALAIVLSGVLVAENVMAQNSTTRRRPSDAERGNSRAGLVDSKTTGSSVRASKLIGMNLQNAQEESVGEIKDIVLNGQTGEIQYVAVTYGGFLGLGNKLFAVPFEAIKVQRDPDDPNDADDYVLVLNVTEEQLEGAQGFDEDSWPNFADENFTRELYQRYNVKRSGNQRLRDVDVKINRRGVDVDVDRDINGLEDDLDLEGEE